MSAPATGYKFGQKNQWRRTLWNRIVERLVVPAADAVVLYLAGADDLDRNEALRRGFRSRNLIAVDRDERIVRKLRADGGIAISADFVDIMIAWGLSRDVHVVVGDFCCGFEAKLASRLSLALLLPQYWSAVMAVNFLRGRDPSSNEYRRAMKAVGWESKHRGELMHVLYCHSVAGLGENPEPDARVTAPARSEYAYRASKPAFLSYRSTSGQVFDSAVWVSPMANSPTIAANRAKLISSWNDSRNAEFRDQVAPAKRKVSAALAHRTMYDDRRTR